MLSLHFVTVQWVLGWIAIGLVWNFFGRAQKNEHMVSGSRRLAAALPILMTYLINFGIPPLLFTQVLYGNFLYTSSVLIGAFWLSVVFLVILTYSALYAGSLRAEKAKSWWGLGLLALVVAMCIAKIYSTNMTLMLRPEVWQDMFRAYPGGTALPPHDPTTTPRWLFMLAGAFTMGGLALVLTGSRVKQNAVEKAFLVSNGGWIAAVGAIIQAAAGWRVLQTQPHAVISKLSENAFYAPLPAAWLGLAVAAAVLGVLALVSREKAGVWLATGASLVGVLLTATMVVYRDGIRDATLQLSGYNVWDLDAKVVPNWSVVIIFVVVFLIGVAITGWMAAVALQSRRNDERNLPEISKSISHE